jgi:hypothetical protein
MVQPPRKRRPQSAAFGLLSWEKNSAKAKDLGVFRTGVMKNDVSLHRKANPMITRALYVTVRLSEEESQAIRGQSYVCHLTMSEYIRRRVLGKRVVPQSDLAVLAELRRLGGLLKHVHNESHGAYSELTADAIRALEAYGRNLERSYKERTERTEGTGPP